MMTGPARSEGGRPRLRVSWEWLTMVRPMRAAASCHWERMPAGAMTYMGRAGSIADATARPIQVFPVPTPSASRAPPCLRIAATARRKESRWSARSQGGGWSGASGGSIARASAAATWLGGAGGPARSQASSGRRIPTSDSATSDGARVSQLGEQPTLSGGESQQFGAAVIEIGLLECARHASARQLEEIGGLKDRLGQREHRDHPGVEPGKSAAGRLRPGSGECPRPSRVEPGGEPEGDPTPIQRNQVAAVERDRGGGRAAVEQCRLEPASHIGPDHSIRRECRPGPEDLPGRPAVMVGTPPQRSVMRSEVPRRSRRKPGERPARFIAGPEDAANRLRSEGANVPPSYCPAHQLRLHVATRIEEGPIEPGFDTEVTGEALPQWWPAPPDSLDQVPDRAVAEHPGSLSELPLGNSAGQVGRAQGEPDDMVLGRR